MTEEPDETTETGTERERVHRPDGGGDGADGGSDGADDALDDLAQRIREKRESQNQRADETPDDTTDPTEGGGFDFSDTAGDSEDAGDELFEEMDVSDVDTDAVWDSVLTDEADGEESGPVSPNVDIDPTVTVDSTVGQDHIVPKDGYCESCQYFSSPPEVACSYEDAAIVEVLEAGQFRVRNCPVVEGFITTGGSVVEQEDDGGIAEETPSD